MTKLKSVFIDSFIKKIIELNMSLKEISTRNDALLDILQDCPRYKELCNMIKTFNPNLEEPKKKNIISNAEKEADKLLKVGD